MFLRPLGLYCSACFGSLFVSILCTCCSHFFSYCFISFTMFCSPVFCLIHWFFSLSSFVIPSKLTVKLRNFAPDHTMKAYGRSKSTAALPRGDVWKRVVTTHRHDRFNPPPPRNTTVPITESAERTSEPVWTFQRPDKYFSTAGTRNPDHPGATPVTPLTTQFRLYR